MNMSRCNFSVLCKYAWVIFVENMRNANTASIPTSIIILCCLATDRLCTSEIFIKYLCPFTINRALQISCSVPSSMMASRNRPPNKFDQSGTSFLNTTFHVFLFSKPSFSFLIASPKISGTRILRFNDFLQMNIIDWRSIIAIGAELHYNFIYVTKYGLALNELYVCRNLVSCLYAGTILAVQLMNIIGQIYCFLSSL